MAWRVTGGVLLVVSSLVIAGSNALADGHLRSLEVSQPSATYAWSGLSLGVGIGAASFNQDIWADASRKDVPKNKRFWSDAEEWCRYSGCETDRKISFREQHGHFNDDRRKTFGTLQIGYDRLIHHRYFLGVFTDLDFFLDGDDGFSKDSFHHKKTIGTLSGDANGECMWTVGGRTGCLLTPRVLVYRLAGYSQMKLDGTSNVDFKGPPGHGAYGAPTHLALSLPEKYHGVTFGAGVEAKIDRKFSLKLEYRFTSLDGEMPITRSVRWRDKSTIF